MLPHKNVENLHAVRTILEQKQVSSISKSGYFHLRYISFISRYLGYGYEYDQIIGELFGNFQIGLYCRHLAKPISSKILKFRFFPFFQSLLQCPSCVQISSLYS